jgi:hypothetical protein
VTVQTVLNILVCVAGFLGGWVLNTLWKTVVDLQKADTTLAEKVAAIEVLVAGKYVTRDALDKALDIMFAKLDRIEDKLDHKADRE